MPNPKVPAVALTAINTENFRASLRIVREFFTEANSMGQPVCQLCNNSGLTPGSRECICIHGWQMRAFFLTPKPNHMEETFYCVIAEPVWNPLKPWRVMCRATRHPIEPEISQIDGAPEMVMCKDCERMHLVLYPPHPMLIEWPFSFNNRGMNAYATSISLGNYCTDSIESGWVLYSRLGGSTWNQITEPIHAPISRPVMMPNVRPSKEMVTVGPNEVTERRWIWTPYTLTEDESE